MLITVFNRVENIVEKGENAGYQHFLLFPQCFQKSCFGKSQDCVVRVKYENNIDWYLKKAFADNFIWLT